ncbi:MAG: hypothetical protein M1838_002074 [Thelocarpon superellum]|nr:MAG: hypothetical protein M1838_002074 [Thelocarpon superellum]
MPKRKTPEEKAERARRKGFDEVMSTIDPSPVHSSLQPCTEALYARQWSLWDQYTKTRPDANPHDLQTAKHFIEFVALGMEGMDDKDGRAKVFTVRETWRGFASAWARRNEKPIPAEYIKGELTRKHGLSTTQRERQFFTVKDFVTLLRQLWQNDWHDYKHEAYRVQLTAALQIFCYTSARVGEVFEYSTRAGTGKGLPYKPHDGSRSISPFSVILGDEMAAESKTPATSVSSFSIEKIDPRLLDG